MITPFGIVMDKNYDFDKGLRLLGEEAQPQLVVHLGRGEYKKPIPAGVADSVVKALSLTQAEALELQRAADRSKQPLSI